MRDPSPAERYAIHHPTAPPRNPPPCCPCTRGPSPHTPFSHCLSAHRQSHLPSRKEMERPAPARRARQHRPALPRPLREAQRHPPTPRLRRTGRPQAHHRLRQTGEHPHPLDLQWFGKARHPQPQPGRVHTPLAHPCPAQRICPGAPLRLHECRRRVIRLHLGADPDPQPTSPSRNPIPAPAAAGTSPSCANGSEADMDRDARDVPRRGEATPNQIAPIHLLRGPPRKAPTQAA